MSVLRLFWEAQNASKDSCSLLAFTENRNSNVKPTAGVLDPLYQPNLIAGRAFPVLFPLELSIHYENALPIIQLSSILNVCRSYGQPVGSWFFGPFSHNIYK